jgi:hypothetical protein
MLPRILVCADSIEFSLASKDLDDALLGLIAIERIPSQSADHPMAAH